MLALPLKASSTSLHSMRLPRLCMIIWCKKDNVSDQELQNESIRKSYQELAEKEIQNGGYRITTTIDKTIHTAMQNAVTNYGYLLNDSSGQPEVGNVLMDNQTGAILGFVRWTRLSDQSKQPRPSIPNVPLPLPPSHYWPTVLLLTKAHGKC